VDDTRVTYVCFVRNIEDGVNEAELKDHFSDCGEVLSVNIIQDKKGGVSKGFGFVEFATEEGREAAVREKSGKRMHLKGGRTGGANDKTLVVQKSTRKTTIYLGGLGYDYSEEYEQDLRDAVEKRCGFRALGIRSKGMYAFVEFANFHCTQTALQRLPRMRFRGREIRVQLAQSDPSEVRNNTMEEVKRTLFIRNLSKRTSEAELRLKFEKFGDITRCEVIRDKYGEPREYGFVGYKQKSDADNAYREMHQTVIDGREIHVEFAKNKSNNTFENDNNKKREDRRRSPRRDRSPQRRSHGRDRGGRDSYRRTDVEDALAGGVPVMVYDANLRKHVLISPDTFNSASRNYRPRRRDRYNRGRY